MKNVLLSIVLLFGLCTVANADIFGPQRTASYKVVNPTTGDQVTIDPNTIFTDVTNIVNYLGVREGTVWDFKRKEFVTYTGATLITWKNISLDIAMLNLDGAGLSIDYNIGQFLPVQNVPILKYTQYLYVGGGYGARFDTPSNKWKEAPFIGAQFKLTF